MIDFHLDKVYPFLVRQSNQSNDGMLTDRSNITFNNETEQEDEDFDKEDSYHQRDTRQNFLTKSNQGQFVSETTQSLMGSSDQ